MPYVVVYDVDHVLLAMNNFPSLIYAHCRI